VESIARAAAEAKCRDQNEYLRESNHPDAARNIVDPTTFADIRWSNFSRLAEKMIGRLSMRESDRP
jgi:hypothetical protein